MVVKDALHEQCCYHAEITQELLDKLRLSKIFKFQGKGIYRCEKPARAIMRTKGVCKQHYDILRKDNMDRQERGQTIPYSFEILSSQRDLKFAIKWATKKIKDLI